MQKYACLMHPEVNQDESGNCPKCGMKLVTYGSLKNRPVSQQDQRSMGTGTWKDYTPLAIIVGLILLTSIVLSVRDL